MARTPIYTNSAAQVTFTNGVSIIAEPNRVMFMEPIADNQVESLHIPSIARKYAHTLPNMEFEAVGINPRGYVAFPNEQEAARKYVTETLLSGGAWLESGDSPMRASLNLVYKFNRAPFYLSVSEAALRNEDETSTPIVMFSGSFSYELSGENGSEKLSLLNQAIDNWEVDLETYSNIINNKFLAKMTETTLVVTTQAAVTDLFTMSAAAIS